MLNIPWFIAFAIAISVSIHAKCKKVSISRKKPYGLNTGALSWGLSVLLVSYLCFMLLGMSLGPLIGSIAMLAMYIVRSRASAAISSSSDSQADDDVAIIAADVPIPQEPTYTLCPSCEQPLDIGPEYAGTEVVCPSCENTFVVPAVTQQETEGTEPPPLPVITYRAFEVSYKSSEESHTMSLAGNGEVTIDGGMISFKDRKGGVSLPLSSVVNVSHEKKVVRFESRVIDDSGVEVAQGCSLSLKSKSDAEVLVGLLPETLTPDVERLISETTAFDLLLRGATRFVIFAPCILVANIVVYVLMVMNGVDPITPTVQQLVESGANYGPLTLSGEYWRLISCVFIHIGIVHLGFNMWVLYSVGNLVERLLGNLHFILIYLVSGLIASMTSLIWNPGVVSAGASGAIFGVYGALGAVLIRRRGEIPPLMLRNIRTSTLGFIAYNIIYGFMNPMIDNAAHVGGLVGGLLIGLVIARPLEPVSRKKLFWPCLMYMGLAVVVLLVGLIALLPRHYGQYASFMETYAQEERLAISWHTNLATQYDSGQIDGITFANQLEKQVLPAWNSLVEHGRNLQIPSGAPEAQQYELLLEIATVRRDAVASLIRGVRNNDEKQFKRFVELQEKGKDLVKKMSEQNL